MNSTNLESKLKIALSGLALGGALVFSGCETPSTNYNSQNSGYSMGASQVVEVQQPRSSDNGIGEFLFGALLGTWGAQRDVPEAAFAGGALANYGAAKAGRSEVNVNVNNPPQNFDRARENLPDREASAGRQVTDAKIQLAYAIDRDGNGKIDFPKELTIKTILTDCSYFDEPSTMIIMVPDSYEGKTIRPIIKDSEGKIFAEIQPKYIEPNEGKPGRFTIGPTTDVRELKEHLLKIGKFGEGGEKRQLLEVYVNDEKIPRETKNFVINYGAFEQPKDPNMRYDPELGEIFILACRYAKDINNDNFLKYPEEYNGLGSRFNLKDENKGIVVFNTGKELLYIRSKVLDSNGNVVYENIAENGYGVTYNLNAILADPDTAKKFKPGKYNFVFYWKKDKTEEKERYAGQKEIELYEQKD